ncbi:MAG: hypothetical protein U0Q11_01085 [Vicinamibacterales bacterium]
MSNRLAFAALGLVCVAAAAGGGYVATRHNTAEQLVATSTPTGMVERTALTTDAPAAQAVTPASPVVTRDEVPAPAERPVAKPAERAAEPAPSRQATSARGSSPAKVTAPKSAPASQTSTRTPSRTDAPVVREEPAAAPAPTISAPVADAPAPAPRAEERAAADTQPSTPATPAAASFDEVVVASDSVIGLRTETALSSERARVEDRVEARVVRDVRVSGRVAIPAGTRALGSVVVVERGGRLKERARLGIRFHTLAMPDGTRLPISTETIYRYGDAPGDQSSKKIGGGAVAGAILGAIIGGGKGAAIGAATGAAGGGAVVMTGDRSEATFPAGGEVTARIVSPVTVTIER